MGVKKVNPYMMETQSGVLFDPLNLHSADVRVTDVAFALARVGRFGGFVPYTVLQHSLGVAELYEHEYGADPPGPVFGALMHDAQEAYLGDLPRPIKRRLKAYRDAEERAIAAIREHFDYAPTPPEAQKIKRCDDIALRLEALAFLPSQGRRYQGDDGVRARAEELRAEDARFVYECLDEPDRTALIAAFCARVINFEEGTAWHARHPEEMKTLRRLCRVSEEEPSIDQGGGGLRLDAGKVRVDLVPPSAVAAMAAVLQMNMKPRGKYDERNWEKGMKWSKCYGPALRHLLDWLDGVREDPEDGLPPSWHLLCDVAFCVHYEMHGIGVDDRPAPKGRSALAIVREVLDRLTKREGSGDVTFSPGARGSNPCTVPYIASGVDRILDEAQPGDPRGADAPAVPED